MIYYQKYTFLNGSVYQEVQNWALDNDNSSFNFLSILKLMDIHNPFFFIKIVHFRAFRFNWICIKKGKKSLFLFPPAIYHVHPK